MVRDVETIKAELVCLKVSGKGNQISKKKKKNISSSVFSSSLLPKLLICCDVLNKLWVLLSLILPCHFI